MFKKFSKHKLTAVSLSTLAFASLASAAVTVDDKGVMTGSLEMGPFYSAVGVVIGAIAVIVAVKAGIRLLKGV